MKLFVAEFRLKRVASPALILIGLSLAIMSGCTSSDTTSQPVSTPGRVSTSQTVEPTLKEPTSTVVAVDHQAGGNGVGSEITLNCPANSGPAVAVNKWAPNRGDGLNEVWVIPVTMDDLSGMKDGQGNPITFAPANDPNADERAAINTYNLGARIECNLTKLGTVNEYVVGVRPASTEILVYRTNEELEELVLRDIKSGLTRTVADFTEQVSIERSGGERKPPMFGPSGDPFPRFAPDGSALAYIEPCWQAARYQEALGFTGLLKKRCQDGGYLVITDLETMDSHVIHGSENDAAIIEGYSWSPNSSAILIQQGCSDLPGVSLPDDPVRNEQAACNGVWTVSAALESDHFQPQQPNPIARFFDCENWDGSVVDQSIWSPTGSSITVSTLAECKRGIWEMDIDSGQFTKITDCPFNPRYLTGPKPCGDMRWSPSGDGLLFITDDEGFGDPAVWVIAMDGGGPRRISPWGFELVNPRDVRWTPDGKWIAFHSFWVNNTPSLWLVDVDDPTKIIAVPDSGSGIRGHLFSWVD